jgi:thiol-disulfide isomerase/thioredoxin
MNPLLIRLFLTVILISAGIGGYRLINQRLLKRANRAPLGLEGQRPNTAAILYFTTPQCVPCKTLQRPALEQLLEQTGEQVQLIEVDAAAQPKIAESWGVLSVPTTFVIDSDGQAREINHGVASTEKLLGQLEQVEGRPLRQPPEINLHRRPVEALGMD